MTKRSGNAVDGDKGSGLTIDQAKREIAAVEAALGKGHPARQLSGSTDGRSATRVAAEMLGVNRVSFANRVGAPNRQGTWKLKFGIEPDWSIKPTPKTIKKPAKLWAEAKVVRRYLLTAAQDETPIHLPFWQNLKAYAAYANAEIIVGGFTYQKGLFEDHAIATGVFASELVPNLRPEVLEIAPRLIWYGTANILPTATDPLSGWDTATRDKWAVFPHAKIALKSIPVMPGAPGKQIMTTGVVTHANYVQRNAGMKAAFHHTIGATIVEVATDGAHFCRQISANAKDGTFQDLDVMARGGKCTSGNKVEAIVWGDIHREMLDPDVAKGAWGFDLELNECGASDSMLDTMKPANSFIHDSFDFTARSHHTRDDPHERVFRRAEGRDQVEADIKLTARFLQAVRRPWTKTVHIDSNHNRHLHRWLKDASCFRDPVNSAYWCELNAAAMRAAEANNHGFLIHEYALRKASGDGLKGVSFLRAGQSYTICCGTAPIECGLHGDIGARGGRGSALTFARQVERINAAHTHEPCIREAVYYAGTSSLLDMKYNTRGPGAWMHAHTINYPAGKRAIITMEGSRWRA